MKTIATIDCETDPFLFGRIPVPFIWGFYTEKFYKVFYKTYDLIEFIKTFDGIIYAHNGGKFDFHFLLDALEPEQKVLIINGRLSKFKIGKCELRDSWLLLPVPLAAYKKDEFDYKKLERDERSNHMPEIEQYLYNDCKYLHEIIKTQIDNYGLKISLPSSAFTFWYKNFSNIDKMPKSTKKFFEKFQPFYYGGRVECFKKGVINNVFKSYDINSAYPYAMQQEHPFGYKYIQRTVLGKNHDEIKRSFIAFRGTSFGVLPFRTKTGLSFPNDDVIREYYCTGHELQQGIETGTIRIHNIITVYEFEQTINFKNYVEHFFKQKQIHKNTDEALYLLAKLYLNSLYGKFAMDGSDHIEYITSEAFDIPDKIDSGYDFHGELGNLALMGKPVLEESQSFYNVATAASITGCVRAYLYKHLNTAEGLLYCDTDSIVCKNLPCDLGKELGQWNCEGEFSGGAIAGKKMYAFKYKNSNKYKIASKGVKLGHKDIYRVAEGETVVFNKDAPVFSIHKEPVFLTRNIRMT